ncbi:MAG: hypothetical protein ACU837_07920 [Gammaproteobacteria bacterium]
MNALISKMAVETHNRDLRYRPIVELVGPAGAGKTTLLRALCERKETICTDVRSALTRRMIFFAGNAVAMFPSYLRTAHCSRWLTRDELRSMAKLHAWHESLTTRPVRADASAVVFDHGPIFRLAQLRQFGPELTKSVAFEQWWENCCRKWLQTLNVVVWLDAPNDVLLERVLGRGHQYLASGISRQEGYAFLQRYRNIYQHLLALSVTNRHLSLLRFETDRQTPQQIAEEVLAALEMKGAAVAREAAD